MIEETTSLPGIFKQQRCMKFYLPKRYVFAFLALMGSIIVYIIRAAVSISIVAMVNHADEIFENNTENECLMNSSQMISNEYKGKQYDWDVREQSHFLGCVSYGNIATHIFGGILAEKFGFKFVYGGGILMTGIITLLIPVFSDLGFTAVIVIRVIQGLGEGLTLPAINAAISIWSPINERSRISAIIFSGLQIGLVIGMPISGLLCSTDFLGGWPSVYYIFGSITCIWFALWWLLIYEKPSAHPTISKEELSYIEENKKEKQSKMSREIWKNIFTSLPMYALMIAHFGFDYGFWILMTELPTYLSTVLHYNLKSNGLFSPLPFLGIAAGGWVSSCIADYLRKSNKLSITVIRKLMTCIGSFMPAIALIGVNFCGCNAVLIITLLCVAMAFLGFSLSGFNVTHVDMCPNFAGTMYAVTNTVANTAGVFGLMSVGFFTFRGPTLANWSNVFYTAAGVYLVSGTLFAVFGTAELQPWGSTKNDLKKPEMNLDNVINIDDLNTPS